MKKFLFITLTALFFTGLNPVSVFSQETETVQTETTLNKREQRKLKKQQEKEEKARLNEEQTLNVEQVEESQTDNSKNFQTQVEEPQTDNSESFQTQPQVEIQPVQQQETEIVRNTYSNNKNVVSSNGEQKGNVEPNNEQSKKSFPTWGWFAFIGIAILGFVIYLYKKYLSQKFAYNIFSVSTIVCLLLSFGTILFLQHLLSQSQTGELWGISSGMFKFLLITALVLTIGVLYYYNFRKTNWYLAIINVIIQTVAVGIFVIIAIGWIVLKFLGGKSSSDTQSNSGTSVSSSNNNATIIKSRWVHDNNKEWVFDGKYLKPRWVHNNNKEWEFDGRYLKQRWVHDNNKEWEFDGRYLKPRWVHDNNREWEFDGRYLKLRWVHDNNKEWEFDGRYLKPRWVHDNNKEWEINGNVPIPVLAKAVGII